ncbi:MAG: polysaccharide deacetylase family protein [Clostridiales bacterium]|nr:polysaccharide deacetylase family protein [Clostridiales bacterium]
MKKTCIEAWQLTDFTLQIGLKMRLISADVVGNHKQFVQPQCSGLESLMKKRWRIAGETLFLAAALFLTSCAQPVLRPASTAPATEEITKRLTEEEVQSTSAALETAAPPPETTAPQISETTAPPPMETIEVEGGGQIDIFAKPPLEETVPEGQYAPSSLMYHLILEEPYTSLTNLFVRPSEFEEHLQALCSAGCEFLFADEYANTKGRSIILTFDDGYEDNYTEMFPILKKYGAKATVFMITANINVPGYLTEDMIREMADSGLVRFDSHTVTHPSLTSLSAEGLQEQFAGSAQRLCDLTGRYPTAICYPGGTINDFVIEEAARYYKFGYTTVNSADTSGCNPLAIPRVRVSRGMSGVAILSRLGWE